MIKMKIEKIIKKKIKMKKMKRFEDGKKVYFAQKKKKKVQEPYSSSK